MLILRRFKKCESHGSGYHKLQPYLYIKYCTLQSLHHQTPLTCLHRCDWGTFLGSIRLGEVSGGLDQLDVVLDTMSREGFSKADYDVMQNSCNTFTEVSNHPHDSSILQEPINKVDHYCDVTVRSSPRGWASLTTSPTPSTTRRSWGPCWRRSSAPWRSPPTSQPSTRTFCSQQPRSQTRATPPSLPTTPWCPHPGTRGGHRKLNLHRLNQ